MEQKTMSVVMNYYRKKYCLNQEDICSGLCSVVTLSRLEAGYREIDSLLCQALLGRIGKEVTMFEIMLNEEDYGLWTIRNKIESDVKKKDFENAKEKILKYRKLMTENEGVHEQFCLYQEALLMIQEKAPLRQLSETLEKGIRITVKNFGEEDHKKQLYNPVEIELILLLFHYDISKSNAAELELLKILKNVTNYYSGKKKEELGTNIYLELIRLKEEKRDYKKIMFYTEEAIQFIGNGMGYHHLADIYFLRAKTRWTVFSERKDWEKYQEKCVQECVIAYHLLELEENNKRRNEIVQFCEEKLQCQITEQGM